MTARQIGVIYFYLVSAASLALTVVGIFSLTTFFINTTQYEEYPLRYYQEDCESIDARFTTKGMPSEVSVGERPTKEELQKMKQQCERRIATERKRQRLDDLKNALIFPGVGLILFLIHFPRAIKSGKQPE